MKYEVLQSEQLSNPLPFLIVFASAAMFANTGWCTVQTCPVTCWISALQRLFPPVLPASMLLTCMAFLLFRNLPEPQHPPFSASAGAPALAALGCASRAAPTARASLHTCRTGKGSREMLAGGMQEDIHHWCLANFSPPSRRWGKCMEILPSWPGELSPELHSSEVFWPDASVNSCPQTHLPPH